MVLADVFSTLTSVVCSTQGGRHVTVQGASSYNTMKDFKIIQTLEDSISKTNPAWNRPFLFTVDFKGRKGPGNG